MGSMTSSYIAGGYQSKAKRIIAILNTHNFKQREAAPKEALPPSSRNLEVHRITDALHKRNKTFWLISLPTNIHEGEQVFEL